MKTLAFVLCVAGTAAAQTPLMSAFNPRYQTMKQNLVEAAEAMPADQYSFKLSPAQRAFGDWVDHTVMLAHSSCAAAKGASPAPMDHSKHSGDKPKAALTQALKEAFAGCDTVFQSMTDAQALASVEIGGKPAYPVNAMLGLLTNMASHYGNMVGYLRAKGVTPPSTARSMKK